MLALTPPGADDRHVDDNRHVKGCFPAMEQPFDTPGRLRGIPMAEQERIRSFVRRAWWARRCTLGVGLLNTFGSILAGAAMVAAIVRGQPVEDAVFWATFGSIALVTFCNWLISRAVREFDWIDQLPEDLLPELHSKE